jgi:hypothetical protein
MLDFDLQNTEMNKYLKTLTRMIDIKKLEIEKLECEIFCIKEAITDIYNKHKEIEKIGE